MNRSFIQSLLEHLLSLLVIFLLLCATAVWSGRLLGHDIGTADLQPQPGQTVYAAPDEAELAQLGLTAKQVKLTPRDSASWQVSDAEGEALGVVLSSAPYAPDIEGFAGPTPLYIYIDVEGKVVAAAAADNAETPDFFARAWQRIVPAWKGKTAEEGAKLQVDGVSGATYSSQAIARNLQTTLAEYAATESRFASAPVIGWGRTAAVALVLLLGVWAAWQARGKRWVRLGVLLLNVGVLGFWCGQFLSLSLLHGWIANGTDPLVYLPTLLMLGVAVVLPFFGRKRHYCTWVCPYGSLQELAGRLPLPKIPCSPKVYRVMRRIRLTVLGLLLLLLWCGLGSFLLDYEPFTAFLVQSASPVVLALAGCFVVASCFVPHLWCHCFCPVGELLDLSENDK